VRHLLAAIVTLGLLAAFFGTAIHLGPSSVVDSADLPTAAAASSGSGVAAFVRVESSEPVYDVLYRYGQNVPAANGAYGPNVTAPRTAWFVEYQRAGAIDVEDGVLRQDPKLIETGLLIFHFGLAREASNGSFLGSAWPFHGTALFLSEAAPALVMLKASPYAGRFASDVKADAALMRRAAHYMVRAVGGPGKIDDHTKNHRFYEAAIALGATGILGGDPALVGWSRTYAWEGIHMERPDGVMPEDGGHDSGYQAQGMVSASRYLELVATGSLARALRTALVRGEAWELSRVAPNGSINQAGDTRTAGCRERDPAGQCKTVFYAPIFSALAHWAAISGDTRFAAAAHQVWLRSGYGGH
jgi:hypothetical protein